MLGVKWMNVCVCWGGGVVGLCACVIMMNIMVVTAQICQDLDCSPNEHTNTRHHGLPYFVTVKCIQAGGSVNPTSHPPPHSFFGIIKHHGDTDNHDCQTTDLYPAPSLHASLRKCHFTFPSGSTLEAVHRRNLWILTQRVC